VEATPGQRHTAGGLGLLAVLEKKDPIQFSSVEKQEKIQ
jgi:hypothetical protein